ncbi:unnamed protein product [Bursaphelenchus okinawaensis]|uniref:Peptidase_M13 domain-containing protein n=1 Tax=Bursaphelenchus okinawaensis TaxID=465554 RepID=A0A811L9H3_9BILA|nr:unnamed protein product [Bursaphelenchus okinawaensis]CAG9121535.1 unnamed protein product [Bursaphelenchus okinawaensis]
MVKVFDLSNKASDNKGKNNTDDTPTSTLSPIPTTGAPNPVPDDELNIADPIVIPEGSTKYQSFKEYTEALTDSMDLKQKPCTNFYEYVCDNYESDTFSKLMMKNQLVLLKAFDNAPTYEAEHKLRGIRERCVKSQKDQDSTKKDIDGTKFVPMYDALVTELGLPFPILDENAAPAKPSAEQLAKAMLYLAKRGANVFAPSGIFPILTDDMNQQKVTVGFSEPSLYSTKYNFDTKESVVKSALTDAFTAYAKKMAVLKGVRDQLKEDKLAEDIEKIWELEKWIASNVLYDQTDQKTFNEKFTFSTIDDASIAIGLFDIRYYLTNLLSDQDQAIKNKVLSNTYKIAIMNQDGLTRLAQHLATLDGRTIYNYIFLKFIRKNAFRITMTPTVQPTNLIVATDVKPVDIEIDFPVDFSPFGIVKTPKPLGKMTLFADDSDDKLRAQCNQVLFQYGAVFGDLFDRFFIDSVLPTEDERNAKYDVVKEVAGNIIDGFRAQINQLPWTDDAKANAYKKVENLQKNFGFNTEILNNNYLNVKYRWLSLPNDYSFFDLADHILQGFLKEQLKNLGETAVDRADFGQPAYLTNAWYKPTANSITIPEGILSPPFFDQNYPLSVLYGSIGMVVGHEIVHGFDNSGVQFNEVGFLKPWLDSPSQGEFDKMAKCVIDQYSDFDVNGNKIQGAYTQGENIADNGGVRAAYNAYKFHVAISGEDPRLPGNYKDLTHDQLFFISFAREFCTTRQYDDDMLHTDPHSPAKFRILGTLQNFPAFKSAFNCKDDESYSKQQCQVYTKVK